MMAGRFEVPYSHPRWWYGGSGIPTCFECAHFRGMVKSKVRCTAFPDGIPRELAISKEKVHTTPYPGDNGIMFEQAED